MSDSRWQPFDTAPKDGDQILATDGYRCVVVSWITNDSDEAGKPYPDAQYGWYIDDGHNDPIHYRGWQYLKYWMPCPETPVQS